MVTIIYSLATRVPGILLHRGEVFPALRETMVSVVCLLTWERIFLSSSLEVQDQRNNIL
jgi:hypothetical protein